MKQTKENQLITIIDHNIRLVLDLSCNEYCIAAYIAAGSARNRQQIGDIFGLSKQSVIKILQRLEAAGITTRDSSGKIHTTEKWNSCFVEIEPFILTQKSKQTLPKNFIFKLWRPAKLHQLEQ